MVVAKFTFNLNGDPAVKLNHVKEAAAKKGVHFQGDGKAGLFRGNIAGGRLAGNYHVSNDKITITIDEKPILAPLSMIKEQMRQFCEE